MSASTFGKGLHGLGNGCWAYLVPDGSWGWSNSGLVTDGDACLLVDTLFDLKLTDEMLRALRKSIPAAEEIGLLVNTHADGDHTFGNQLVEGARIIGTQGTVDDFARFDPKVLETICTDAAPYGAAGAFIQECFRPFDFSGITLTPPTEVFKGTLSLMVGAKRVDLIEVGPAHSLGDTLVHVPEDKVVYTGDILFSAGTPIAWYGPVSRWIGACETILAMDVEVVVAGHGPVSTKDDVRTMRDYLVFVTEQARPRHEAGMGYLEAAYDIDLGAYREWNDAERVVVTLQTLFDDFDAAAERPSRPPLPYFAQMKAFRDHLGRGPVHEAWCRACGLTHPSLR